LASALSALPLICCFPEKPARDRIPVVFSGCVQPLCAPQKAKGRRPDSVGATASEKFSQPLKTVNISQLKVESQKSKVQS
jgi:hypothetical protein